MHSHLTWEQNWRPERRWCYKDTQAHAVWGGWEQRVCQIHVRTGGDRSVSGQLCHTLAATGVWTRLGGAHPSSQQPEAEAIWDPLSKMNKWKTEQSQRSLATLSLQEDSLKSSGQARKGWWEWAEEIVFSMHEAPDCWPVPSGQTWNQHLQVILYRLSRWYLYI